MRKPKDVIIHGRTLEDILKEYKEFHFHDRHLYLSKTLNKPNKVFLDLSGIDLKEVDLSKAYLRGVQLASTDLRSANLSGSDLSFANLSDARLDYADMTFSTLTYANLSYASLYSVNLCDAIMKEADLQRAYLQSANLSRADLNYARIEGANLVGANLYETKGAIRGGQVLTEDLIGYKICSNGCFKKVVVTLKIPKGAIVFSINGKKCRTNKVEVIAIDEGNRAYSYYNDMSYYVGDKITINNFNCQYNVECSTGIHFFKSRKEAEQYKFG